jgi:hypothetical protein
VSDKKERVYQFQAKTINSAMQIVASMGLDSFDDLTPRKLFRRVDPQVTKTYHDLFRWLSPGELLDTPPEGWRRDWGAAAAHTFAPVEYTPAQQ